MRSWRLLGWLAALAALVVAGLARPSAPGSRRRAAGAAPSRRRCRCDVRTRQALDALEAEDLPEQGMQREFYFRLSGVVRGYLGERFGFDALECTSGELLREVERRRPPGVALGALRRFVDQCDVARYARAEVPVAGLRHGAGVRPLELVATTRSEPAPPPPRPRPPDAAGAAA